MSEKEPSSESRPTDPRLKSFLRKAGAIIATEKGLNAASRLKLQTLAKHLKLPEELLDEALLRLQKSSESGTNLTHYEKAFTKFLKSEFEKISGDVLSRGMEVKAIRLAETKYQINSTRAEQLINSETEAAGFSRISQAEAESFASRTIAEQIRDQTVVDDELKIRLLKIGKKWGIESEDVAQIITHKVRENRANQKKSFNLAARLAVCSTLIGVGLVGAIIFGVIPNWIGLPDGLLVHSFNEDGKPNEQSDPTGVVPNTNGENASSRLPDAVIEQFKLLENSDARMRVPLQKILVGNQTQRRIGYQQLTNEFCGTDGRQVALSNLIVRLFYEDPDEDSIAVVIRTLAESLVAKETGSVKTIGTVRDLKNSYKANQMLCDLLFFEEAKAVNSRFQLVAQCVATRIGVPVDEVKTKPEYRKLSESLIATDQWTQMKQNSWKSPRQVALMTLPLVELTTAKLKPEQLSLYRGEVVLSVLKTDDAYWDDMLSLIRNSVDESSETKLSEWIDIFESTESQSFKKMLGASLLKRLNIKLKSNRIEDFVAAIQRYKLDRQSRELRPVILRNQMLVKTFENAYDTFQVEESGGKSLPDRIAEIVRAVNLGMAFCEAMEKAVIFDDSSFVEFDRLNDSPKSLLRNSISLPIDRSRLRDAERPEGTASDIRRKESALERLGDRDPENSGLRVLALNQLERVSPRFKRLTYVEATVLAKYLLSNLDTKELLNVQRVIPAFVQWPNLGLALADQLETSDVSKSQAVIISRLLLSSDLEIDDEDDWKQPLRAAVLRAVSTNLENQVRQDPNNSNSNWQRLEIYLRQAYRQRAAIFSRSFAENANAAPYRSLIVLIRSLASTRLDREGRQKIERASKLVDDLDSHEIDKTIFANQLLIEVLSTELSKSGKSDLVRPLMSEFQIGFGQNQLAGDQLFLTELVLLRLVELKKEMLVQQLLDGK
ncbi:MAG: hypothetical protein AB8B55_02655 [Mariniblastus sp.]